MNRVHLPFAATLLLAACPLAVVASDALQESEIVIVTATRTARTVDDTLAAVTLFTRRDIERTQAQSLPDLLRGTPGLSLSNSGGAGKLTSLFLRGAEPDHLLVLIDGIKVGSATDGTTAIQDIPLDQVERIEIVRGPRSSLYGSEAIGGVIQIFTRKGGGALSPFVSAGGGSHGTGQGAVGLSGGGANGWFNARVNASRSRGFNACRGNPSAGCFTTEPDKDGYDNQSAALRGGYRFDNGVEVDVHALRNDSYTEYDGDFDNQTDAIRQVLGASLRLSPLQAWRLNLSAGRSWDDTDTLKDGIFQSRFNTRRDTVSMQNDVSLGKAHLVTVGFDYQDDSIDSTVAYDLTSRDNTGMFLQYQAGFGGHNVQASIRQDDNEQFGHHVTGGLSWGYAWSEALRLSASHGTAFKAPTFNELYYPGFSEPNLRPETAATTEVGLTGRTALGRLSLQVFQTRIKDLITYDASISKPVNIDRARVRGVEVVHDISSGNWNLRTAVNWLDPKNQAAGANNGKVLARRVRQSLRMEVDRTIGEHSVGLTFLAESARFDEVANTTRVGGYGLLDLRAEYRLTKALRLQARVENVLDKQYETFAYFYQPGRSAYVFLRYEP